MDNLISSVMNSQNANSNTTMTNVNSKDVNKLLSKQMLTNNNFNDLIDNATKMMFCGPGSECEKQQITDSLERKYLDAQTNEQVAPLRLQNAKKYYYIYKEGRPYYNDMIEKEYKQKVDAIANQITEKFNEEIENANTMNGFYNNIQMNSENTIELYEDYLKKNAEMQQIIKTSHGDVLTNDRKTYYETEALDRLKTWYTILSSLYWVLFIAFVISLFLSPSNLSRTKQILLVIFFVIYPFIVHKVVLYFYKYFNTLLIKNTEMNVYMNL
jgi:hypothetical protein